MTSAGKGQDTLFNLAATYRIAKVQRGIQFFYIDHCGAVVADKVGVGLGVTLEAFIPGNDTYGADEAFFLKHSQVPIYRTKGEVRYLRLKPGIDPFGRGV